MLDVPKIEPALLGRRLTDARKARGLTQSDAAEHLGCSRPTLIAIEKGTRPASAREIMTLASLYGRTVHELVRPGEPVADLEPHLRAAARKAGGPSVDLDEAIEALQRFAENYCQLERIMDAPLAYNYPPQVGVDGRVNLRQLAEDVATRERSRLGLGDQPIGDLRQLLEAEVGLRIIYGSLPAPIAGMYVYAGDLGCCILVNRKHPAERRRATLAHEYGHVLADRHKPGIDYLSYQGRKPANERFAESFGMALLMPGTSVRRGFNDTVSASGDFQVADLCRMSHFYFVSVQAMAYRLEGLGLIPQGTVQHLQESKFEVRKAKGILGLSPQSQTNDRLPDRYVFLAVQAYEQAKISEGQLAKFLECDRVTARAIVEQCAQSTTIDEYGNVEEYRFDLPRSLLAQR